MCYNGCCKVKSSIEAIFVYREECQQAVNGFSGARFKKFDSHEEAADFVGGSDERSSSSYSSRINDSVRETVVIIAVFNKFNFISYVQHLLHCLWKQFMTNLNGS